MNWDVEGKIRSLECWIENKKGGLNIIIGRDFNVIMDTEGGGLMEGDEDGVERQRRKSKDIK